MAKPPWPLLAKLLVVDDEPGRADVLVVLEGDSERDLYAVQLYQLGLAPKIIISGCGGGQKAQAVAAAGVREKDILVDDKSENTYQNAVYSKDIIAAQNFKSAIIITSPYHMRRTKLVFGRVFSGAGVKLLYCPTKDSGFNVDGQCKSDIDRQIVRSEYIKLVYYWCRYW